MICPKCDGDRVVWNYEWEEEQECDACKGHGEVDSEEYEDL